MSKEKEILNLADRTMKDKTSLSHGNLVPIKYRTVEFVIVLCTHMGFLSIK